MAVIPRKCEHCGSLVYHYGSCACPKGQLDSIDAERTQLKQRLVRLDVREREEMKRWLTDNKIIGGKAPLPSGE